MLLEYFFKVIDTFHFRKWYILIFVRTYSRGGSKILFFSNQKPKYFFSQFNLYDGVWNQKKLILVKNAEGPGTFVEEVCDGIFSSPKMA